LYYNLYAFNETNISANAPLVIWLEGGPGCSSMWDSFEALGPVQVLGSENNFTFVRNNYTWNKLAHLLFIDQPAGTGFSVQNGLNVSTTWQAAEMFNIFLARFYQLFPMLQNKGLYIFGESYGGKYVPVFTYTLLQNKTFSNQVKILGAGVGNPWSDPIAQARTYSTFGYVTGLIDQRGRDILNSNETTIFEKIANQEWWQATYLADQIIHDLTDMAGDITMYDYREYDPYYGEYIDWLNTPEAQSFLGIPPTEYDDCNSDVSDDFYGDNCQSVAWVFPELLKQIPFIFYQGQDDPLCDYEGVMNFINELNWPKIKEFRKSKRVPWKLTNGTIAGLAKSYSNLTMLLIFKAGHMVPWNQPRSAYEMLYNFMNNISFVSNQ